MLNVIFLFISHVPFVFCIVFTFQSTNPAVYATKLAEVFIVAVTDHDDEVEKQGHSDILEAFFSDHESSLLSYHGSLQAKLVQDRSQIISKYQEKKKTILKNSLTSKHNLLSNKNRDEQNLKMKNEFKADAVRLKQRTRRAEWEAKLKQLETEENNALEAEIRDGVQQHADVHDALEAERKKTFDDALVDLASLYDPNGDVESNLEKSKQVCRALTKAVKRAHKYEDMKRKRRMETAMTPRRHLCSASTSTTPGRFSPSRFMSPHVLKQLTSSASPSPGIKPTRLTMQIEEEEAKEEDRVSTVASRSPPAYPFKNVLESPGVASTSTTEDQSAGGGASKDGYVEVPSCGLGRGTPKSVNAEDPSGGLSDGTPKSGHVEDPSGGIGGSVLKSGYVAGPNDSTLTLQTNAASVERQTTLSTPKTGTTNIHKLSPVIQKALKDGGAGVVLLSPKNQYEDLARLSSFEEVQATICQEMQVEPKMSVLEHMTGQELTNLVDRLIMRGINKNDGYRKYLQERDADPNWDLAWLWGHSHCSTSLKYKYKTRTTIGQKKARLALMLGFEKDIAYARLEKRKNAIAKAQKVEAKNI